MKRIKGVVWALICLVAFIGAVWIGADYRRDVDAARERLATGSQIAETRCGPIEYAVAGEGPPVLVVHGAGGGFDQGLIIGAPLVKAGFRVIAVSRFGYLRTPLPQDASAAAQADAHACLLDALGIPRTAILGASAGAPSAMQFAIRHPERCRALVLLVPATFMPRSGEEPSVKRPPGLVALFSTLLRSDFLFWLAPHISRAAVEKAIMGTPPAVVEQASPAEQARMLQMIDQIMPVSPRRLGLLNDGAVVTTLPRYDLERIDAPTLVIDAADDLYGFYAGAQYTAAHIPGARFVGYPTGGHMLIGRQDEIEAQITAFLR
ncbi:MAG TPA: alpha/beta hydrolase [Gammaproteobacteria bacterium]|nr:alpha/beta hydrolase [Gammaproteobacteria bacterium]